MPTTLPDVIYRYQPMGPAAIDLIKNGRLWFSDPSRFNDPFDFIPSFAAAEGQIRRALDQSRESKRWSDFGELSRSQFLRATAAQHFNLLHRELRIRYRQFRKDFAKSFRVACFSELKDDLLMWSHYAGHHLGFCVGIRPHGMGIPAEKGLRWRVEYNDERLPLSRDTINTLALRKTKVWSHEKEWRVIMSVKDLNLGNRPLRKKEERKGLDYYLKLHHDAIESVRFGALVDTRQRNSVISLLRRELPSVTAIQMHLASSRLLSKNKPSVTNRLGSQCGLRLASSAG